MNNTTMGAMTTGCMCFWDTSATEARRLWNELVSLGLEKFAPGPRTAESALQMSLRDLGKRMESNCVDGNGANHKYLVQAKLSRSDDGFELVDVSKRSSQANDYDMLVTAKVSNECVVITDGYADTYQLQEAYEKYRHEAPGSAVGRSLVAIISHLHGTCVRPVGGVYYLPEDTVATWDDVVAAYERCGKNIISRIRVVLDEQAARTIRRAIVQELGEEAAKVVDDLRRNDIRDETIQRRLSRAAELRDKAHRYEEILNDTLGEVHSILNMAEASQGIAQAVKDDGDVFDETFA